MIIKEKTALLEESGRQKEHLVGRIVALQQQLETSASQLASVEAQLATAEQRASKGLGQADDYKVRGGLEVMSSFECGVGEVFDFIGIF